MTRRHVGLALLVVLIWGLNFVIIDAGLQDVPPVLFAAIRFSVIAPLALVVPRPRARRRDLIAVGLLMFAGQFGFLYTGLAAGLPAGLASLVVQSMIGFTVLLAVPLLGERPTPIQGLGLVVGAMGLLVVALGRQSATSGLGLALAIGGAACWAAGNIVARRIQAPALGLVVWGALVAAGPLWLLSLTVEGSHRISVALQQFSMVAVLSAGYTVVLATLVAYSIWNWLLARHPAVVVTPFTLLVPVIGMAAAAVFSGERPGALEVLGGVVLLFGVGAMVLGDAVLTRWRLSPPVPSAEGGQLP